MDRSTPELAQALGLPSADKRLEILRQVAAQGSISQAARQVGVSYKAAWQALDTLSNLAGAVLVERAVGGAGGGGARLTPAGLALVQAADALFRSRAQVLARLDGPAQGLSGLALRTSIRNQFPATVRRVARVAGALRVELRLAGGQQLAARITRESGELLGLAPGLGLLALCKATAVEVLAASPADAGERNVLAGRITRASRAKGGGEAGVALDGGLQLVGFAGPGSGLRPGAQAWAVFDPAAVVLALG